MKTFALISILSPGVDASMWFWRGIFKDDFNIPLTLTPHYSGSKNIWCNYFAILNNESSKAILTI